jgi:hypothetical protein
MSAASRALRISGCGGALITEGVLSGAVERR